MKLKWLWGMVFFCLLSTPVLARDFLRVGSKKFTESYLLAELMAQQIEQKLKIPVERKFGLGGTYVCFEALKNNEIDIYPEYLGTVLEVILKTKEDLDFDTSNDQLKKRFGIAWGKPFGFNNSYALAMQRQRGEELAITKNSDLLKYPQLRFAFSHEFLNRNDGWPALKAFYGFQPLQPVMAMEHTLTYEGLKEGVIDIVDAYTTDAKILSYHLTVLEDDKRFFPDYFAAPLLRLEVLQKFPQLESILKLMEGILSNETMRRLNEQAEVEKKSFQEVVQEFLNEPSSMRKISLWSLLLQRTLRHLKLVFLSVLLACLIGIPLGVVITRLRFLAQPVLYVTGIVQTIPSIALLALMIPLFGIGEVPALVALFIYGLLPIVRNTYIGLKGIPWNILEAADGIGLRPARKLRYVELPLAFSTILGGVKTSAVINVGTATLAAFIGAGGLGEPIVTGLALNDVRLILQGAIPAALLAILLEFSLSLFEKRFGSNPN